MIEHTSQGQCKICSTNCVESSENEKYRSLSSGVCIDCIGEIDRRPIRDQSGFTTSYNVYEKTNKKNNWIIKSLD